MRNFLREEIDQSNNIKSKQTRNGVQVALKSILRILKDTKTFQPNGVALFSGITREKGPVTTCLVSPIRISKKIYICGKHFETDLLKDEMKKATGDSISYIILDGNSCHVYLVTGPTCKSLYSKNVSLDTDTSKGGQSQNRHGRNREIQRDSYLKIVTEAARKVLEPLFPNLLTVFIAGSGDLKRQLRKHYDLLGPVQTKLNSNILTISKGGREGMKEATRLAAQILDRSCMKNESEKMNKLKRLMEEHPNRIRYGKMDIDSVIYLVQEIFTTEKNSPYEELVSTHYISGRTPESQFLLGIGGTAAILFYDIEDADNSDEIQN